jgi:AraC-like DNA-binding protein
VIETGPDERIYPVAKLATIVEALVAEGVAPAAALKESKLAASAISGSQTRVSLNQIIQCCRNAIALSRDPFFAYRAGLRFHVSTQGMYGFAILSSTDFRKTIQFAIKYHRLATPLAEISFREENDRGIWFISPAPYPQVDAAVYKFLLDLQLGIHVSLHRDIMGPSFAPQEIHVTYRPSLDSRQYSNAFGCPVLFEQPENKLVFDAAWLSGSAELGNEITHAVVVRLCDGLLDEFQRRTGIAGKVRDALLVNLAGPPSFDAVAQYLKISARTLRRRLQEIDLSYRELVDELRMYVAIKYLRDTTMTIEDVADALGFGDAAGFRRAFRRWTRQSPDAFRRASGRFAIVDDATRLGVKH